MKSLEKMNQIRTTEGKGDERKVNFPTSRTEKTKEFLGENQKTNNFKNEIQLLPGNQLIDVYIKDTSQGKPQ